MDADLKVAGRTPANPVPEPADADLIADVLNGSIESFEPLIRRYQPRVFATARRYARRESEVEDIVQEVFVKAFQKLQTYHARAPFEHWLMRLTVRTCYDFLRAHRRRPEISLSDYTETEANALQHLASQNDSNPVDAAAAKEVVQALFEKLSAPARLVLTLLELEDRSVKEVAALTGWSPTLVKVRAFRARAEMRKCLELMLRRKQL